MHNDKVTTPTISTLLLVPADGDPLGLLAPGAPVGDTSGARGWVVPRGPLWPLGDEHCKPQNSAAVGTGLVVWRPGYGVTALLGWGLLLADEGEPVTAGCDKADHGRPGADWRHLPPRQVARAVLNLLFGVDLGLREWLAPIGTLIALDPAGRDVTDEVLRGR